jgi:hypothetical protein
VREIQKQLFAERLMADYAHIRDRKETKRRITKDTDSFVWIFQEACWLSKPLVSFEARFKKVDSRHIRSLLSDWSGIGIANRLGPSVQVTDFNRYPLVKVSRPPLLSVRGNPLLSGFFRNWSALSH